MKKDIYLPLKLRFLNHYFVVLSKIIDMAKITVKNLFNKTFNASLGSGTIFNALQEERIDWMHACGTKGRCTTCKFIVVEGSANISPKSEAELKFETLNRLGENERLACQCSAIDDITILVPESSKMPHINYSN